MTGEAERIQSEIIKLEIELEDLKNSICDYCFGEGDIVDKTRITVTTIEIPFCKCPECMGAGIKN